MTLFTIIVFGYFDVYFEIFITIKTGEKVYNNLINESIFPLTISSLRQDV